MTIYNSGSIRIKELNNKQDEQLIYYFKKRRLPFICSYTGKTMSIQNKEEKYIISSDYLGRGLMRIMSSLKSEIEKRTTNKIIGDVDPAFYGINLDWFNKKNGRGTLKDIIEVDLSSAYLTATLELDYISKETFNKINAMKKCNRLRVLGSIATKKIIEEYDIKGNRINRSIERDEYFLRIWMNICNRVSFHISELIDLNSYFRYIFYWADNIFFAGDLSIKVPEHLQVKSEKHEYIKYLFGNNNVMLTIDDGRTFNFNA